MMAHLETENCAVTRIKLDKLAVGCRDSKDYVIPGCEAYLRNGERRKWKAKANFNNNTCNRCDRHFSSTEGLVSHVDSSYHHRLAYQYHGCQAKSADLSGLLLHVENSPCSEGISYGTGSIGRLLQLLWKHIADG